METFYIYRHIRLDTNEPFYIGIGKVYRPSAKKHEDYYSRAFQNNKRNRFWHFITDKTDYEVEILFECNNRDAILEKEIEFIKLYGRRDLGEGTLVNLTDGGDGMNNNIQSEETINKRKQMYKEGKTGLKPLRGGDSPMSKKVIEESTGIIFNSCTEAANYIGIKVSNFTEQLTSTSRRNSTGFKFLDDSFNKDYICKKRDVKLYDYSTENIIESISEGSRIYNISHRSLRGYLDGICRNKTPLVYYEDFLKGVLPNDLFVNKKNTVKVLDTETGAIYESINEASRVSGIHKSTLKSKLSGRSFNNTKYVGLDVDNNHCQLF